MVESLESVVVVTPKEAFPGSAHLDERIVGGWAPEARGKSTAHGVDRGGRGRHDALTQCGYQPRRCIRGTAHRSHGAHHLAGGDIDHLNQDPESVSFAEEVSGEHRA